MTKAEELLTDIKEQPIEQDDKRFIKGSDNETLQDFGFLDLSDTKRIYIALRRLKTHKYLDIREFYNTGNGDWKFSKKGFTLVPESLVVNQFIEILNKVNKFLEE